MDIISFRFLLALTVQMSLHIFLLDVTTIFLYDVLDTKLFIWGSLDLIVRINENSNNRML